MEDERQAVRRRWAGVAVVALLLVLAGGVARMTRAVDGPPRSRPVPIEPMDPQGLRTPTTAKVDRLLIATTPTAVAGASSPSLASIAGEAFDCEAETASSPRRDEAAARQREAASIDTALKRLAASGNAVDRAVAMLVAPLPDAVASQALGSSARQQKAYFQAEEHVREDRVRALADFARQVEDPTVQRLVVQACVPRMQRLATACAGFTPLSWAQNDPSNGTAWLAVASEAQARGDAGGVDDALYRAANASRFESGFRISTRAVYALGAADVSEEARTMLVVQSLGAWAPTMNTSVLAACGNDAVASDANRLQACISLGRKLVDASDEYRDASLGALLLERLAQDPEPRRALRALREAAWRTNVAAGAASPCEGARAILRQTRRDAEIGELAAMREAAASGPR